jgi:hypothetical protein
MKARRGLSMVAVLLLLVSLSSFACGVPSPFGGCAPGRPDGITTTDLVGTYSGQNAGTLVLNGDGSFTASELDVGFGDQGITAKSGTGTWTLQDRDSLQTDVSLVFVGPDGTEGGWDLIDVAGTKAEPLLWYFYGDPDECNLREMKRTSR